MPDQTLCGCRMLTVEDEHVLAHALATALTDAGATVVEPLGMLAGATTVIKVNVPVDGGHSRRRFWWRDGRTRRASRRWTGSRSPSLSSV